MKSPFAWRLRERDRASDFRFFCSKTYRVLCVSPELCDERLRLLTEYQRKAAAYAAAVSKQVEQLGVVSDIEYGRLNQRAELTRYAAADARAALQEWAAAARQTFPTQPGPRQRSRFCTRDSARPDWRSFRAFAAAADTMDK